MSDGVDSSQLIKNERAKVGGSTLARLGSVLIAAALAKIYVDQSFSVAAVVWIVGAAVLWWAAWEWLGTMLKES